MVPDCLSPHTQATHERRQSDRHRLLRNFKSRRTIRLSAMPSSQEIREEAECSLVPTGWKLSSAVKLSGEGCVVTEKETDELPAVTRKVGQQNARSKRSFVCRGPAYGEEVGDHVRKGGKRSPQEEDGARLLAPRISAWVAGWLMFSARPNHDRHDGIGKMTWLPPKATLQPGDDAEIGGC